MFHLQWHNPIGWLRSLVVFQQAAELSRVLDETAASYEELQATHRAALEELSALKRWIYGRRTPCLGRTLTSNRRFSIL
jgi:hypothetical protein